MMRDRILSLTVAIAVSIAPALAQAPGLFNPMLLSSSVPKVVTWITDAENSGTASTYTFSGINIGTGSSDLRVIVGTAGGANSRSVSSITIGGVTATALLTPGPTNLDTAGMFIANVPAGGTVSIVVTWSSGQARCGVTAWTLTGATSNTPIDTKTATSSTSPSPAALTTVSGGVAVGYMAAHSSAGFTWSGLGKRFDIAIGGTSLSHTGADATTTGSSLTVSGTSPTATGETMLLASF